MTYRHDLPCVLDDLGEYQRYHSTVTSTFPED